MWFVVRNVIDPIIMSIWQRSCPDPASIQIANYNLAETEMGNWHHDESSDISVVVHSIQDHTRAAAQSFITLASSSHCLTAMV